MLKRSLSPALVGAAILATAGLAVLGHAAITHPTQDNSEASTQAAMLGEPVEQALTIFQSDRDGTRRLSVVHQSATAMESATLTTDNAINVTSITIQNGLFANGNAKRGGLSLVTGNVVHNFAFDGYGNAHYTFPTPIRMVSGDTITINVPGGNSTAWTQVVLIGTPPTSQSSMVIF